MVMCMRKRVVLVIDEEYIELSSASSRLWAKSDDGLNEEWLPLFLHMIDAAHVARMLWDCWVPIGVKDIIARAMDVNCDLAKRVTVLLAGLHDLGKAVPAFQAQPLRHGGILIENLFIGDLKRRGFGFPQDGDATSNTAPRHAWCSAAFYLSYLHGLPACGSREMKSAAASLATILALHHGSTPNEPIRPRTLKQYASKLGTKEPAWIDARLELIALIERIAGIQESDYIRILSSNGMGAAGVPANVGVLLTGICIMADWLASNRDFFPLLPMIPSTSAGRTLQNGRVSLADLEARAQDAFDVIDILPPWCGQRGSFLNISDDFADRFGLPAQASPRPVQIDAVELARSASHGGLMIIEAPMGEGKTEAALAVAEIFASQSGRGGVAVALPTMATTDAMFGRVHKWLDGLPQPDGTEARSIYLAHGKSRLNDEFQGIVARSRKFVRQYYNEAMESGNLALADLMSQRDEVVASDWLFGRKKGMLANFVVCTIDQVLMGALSMKHLALRDLGLANKVLIIDECHAYDAYMQVYLERLLEWLGCWSVPVIMLSATLPEETRRRFVAAYELGVDACTPSEHTHTIDAVVPTIDSYPLLTLADGEQIRCCESKPSARSCQVRLACIDDDVDVLVDLIDRASTQGGCIGVICNTVRRAQEAADVLSSKYGDEVLLTHSRFTDLDRMERENEIRRLLGANATRSNGTRPDRLIVVGTQVLEQSLDIDFDMLVSDIAPVDLVFQRLGRMHRHDRGRDGRPDGLQEARCYIRGITGWHADGPSLQAGVESIYGKASLFESLVSLGLVCPESQVMVDIPADIASKVRTAYSDRRDLLIPDGWQKGYREACDERERKMTIKRIRAEHCLVESAATLLERGHGLGEWCRKADASTGGAARDDDWGPRAVRDTEETVEVILLCREDDGLHLLPWIGDEEHGVPQGARVSADAVPSFDEQKVIANSTVRLPLEMCSADKIEPLIIELEKWCGALLGAWVDAPLLAGSLVLLLDRLQGENYGTSIAGHKIWYSKYQGIKSCSL